MPTCVEITACAVIFLRFCISNDTVSTLIVPTCVHGIFADYQHYQETFIVASLNIKVVYAVLCFFAFALLEVDFFILVELE